MSSAKISKHKKALHTKARQETTPEQSILVEDMSVCNVNEDQEAISQKIEELMTERKYCEECDFVSSDELMLETHLNDAHTATLSEEVAVPPVVIQPPIVAQPPVVTQPPVTKQPPFVKQPPVVKALPLYKCNECLFATITTDDLKEHKNDTHVKVQHSKKETSFLHSCISCTFQTNEFSHLLEHTDNIHKRKADNNLLVADNAVKDAQTSDNIESHVSDHTSPLGCDICDQEHNSLLDLEWHMETEHNEVECFSCSRCTFNFNTLSKLQEHIAQTHAHPCTKCDEILSSEGDLSLHFTSVHAAALPGVADNKESPVPEVPALTDIKCDQCSFVAADVTAIILHVRNDHTEEPCQYCEHVANDREGLKDHMYETHGEVVMIHTMAQQINTLSENER